MKWNNWDVISCSIGEYEFIIGVSFGPRILSATCKGNENLLYLDSTNFGVDDWRIYGGHRFTIAPEGPESYFPDNDPCKYRISRSKFIVTAPVKPNGLSLSMEISEGIGEGRVEINHVLKNIGNKKWKGALWSITCVPRSSMVLGYYTEGKMNFWPGTDPLNWNVTENYISAKDGNFRGKVGWHSVHPKLIAQREQGTLIISGTELSYPEECVDNGSNSEIFTCSDYTELETLSKSLEVAPGESASYKQQWQLISPGDFPTNHFL